MNNEEKNLFLEVIKKLSNEFQEIEKTIFDTENARAKVEKTIAY